MDFKPKITLFHCINVFGQKIPPAPGRQDAADIKVVQMACSAMVKDVFLLRAFESGADAVIVLVCPEGRCRHLEGNIRARRRVDWVKKLLEEIGLGGWRLSLFHIRPGDTEFLDILNNTLTDLAEMGPNPAA
ncbi:MAG: hydrogenase iron-sulfur subunit [Desulfobacterales bacterium]|nr:hydrogenase iron-sulfur subunit [Desulfobacterales bacterium]